MQPEGDTSLHLSALPLGVVEAIGSKVDIRSRVAFTSCCYSLRAERSDVAGSPVLWGCLDCNIHPCTAPSLAAWLRHRRAGLRRLHLRCAGPVPAPARAVCTVLCSLLGASGLEVLELEPAGVLLPLAAQGHDSSEVLEELLSCGERVYSVPPSQLTVLQQFLQQRDVNDSAEQRQQRQRQHVPAAASPGPSSGARGSSSGWQVDQVPPETGNEQQPAVEEDEEEEGEEGEEGEAAALQALASVAQLTALKVSPTLAPALGSLPAALSALGSLAQLELVSSVLDEPGALLPLQYLSCLSRLVLVDCDIERLPAELSSLHSSLVHLDVHYNPLGQGGSPALEAALRHLTALTALSIGNIYPRMRPPPALSALAALRELDLSVLELGEEVDLEPLRGLAALSRLDLSFNRFRRLPCLLASLPALAWLDLSYNALLGQAAEDAWDILPRLTCLQWLGLRCCKLGHLPRQLAAMPALAELSIESNEGLGQDGEAVRQLVQQLGALTLLKAGGCGLDTWLTDD